MVGMVINILICSLLLVMHFCVGITMALLIDCLYNSNVEPLNPLHIFITKLIWPYGILFVIGRWLYDSILEIIMYYKEKK